MDLSVSGGLGGEGDNSIHHNSNEEPTVADSQPINSEFEKQQDTEYVENCRNDTDIEESQLMSGPEIDKDLVESQTILHENVEVTETVEENMINVSSSVCIENGLLTAHEATNIHISGSKRPRTTFEEQNPSVHVMYNCLTRDSKQKLEALLQKWSEWHAQHVPPTHDGNEGLESGEETYFPAVLSLDKSSAVPFWIDDQSWKWKEKEEELPSPNNDSVPLYDREYALGLTLEDGSSNLEGGLEVVDASRCFNCGSYSHSLKECTKPRDSAAVNKARKQHKSKRKQHTGSRNPTRYYQDSPGGRYDGLRPGVLDAETRKLLGIGELDPPPWLNRMREMGYPPGYLDPQDEHQPSGITIYGDEETKQEQEDGEILETATSEPPRKTSVEFPGVNAPIPKDADERRWASGPSSAESHETRSQRRPKHYSSESNSRGPNSDQRWPRDFRDVGCDPNRMSPSMSSYPPRYGGYDYGYNSQSHSPSFRRSISDRGRVHEGGSYGSLTYSSPNITFGNRVDETRYFTRDHSSHSMDKHHSRR